MRASCKSLRFRQISCRYSILSDFLMKIRRPCWCSGAFCLRSVGAFAWRSSSSSGPPAPWLLTDSGRLAVLCSAPVWSRRMDWAPIQVQKDSWGAACFSSDQSRLSLAQMLKRLENKSHLGGVLKMSRSLLWSSVELAMAWLCQHWPVLTCTKFVFRLLLSAYWCPSAAASWFSPSPPIAWASGLATFSTRLRFPCSWLGASPS